MKYILFLSVIGFIGCGEDSSSTAPISQAQQRTQNVQTTMDSHMPDFKTLCVDNNLALFPAQYANCLPVFGKDECDNDQAINTQKLNNEWQNIMAWTQTTLLECVLTNTADQCFAISQQELARRSDACSQVVTWL